MTNAPHSKKLLIFIVAYKASSTIVDVLDRIPAAIADNFEVEILVIDDCSDDDTHQIARAHLAQFWCPGTALKNPINLGYGGNQKVGYQYALDNGFDIVAMVHGDGQYAPEYLPQLLKPFQEDDDTAVVLGSRMLYKKNALKGGMPYYKFMGNIILTRFQNILLGSNLAEFHTGYRIYAAKALRAVQFNLNTNDFHFDTEILVQMFFSRQKIVEVPIPTHYGDEECNVDGLSYAWNVSKASIKARLIKMGIFFDPKFCLAMENTDKYVSKFSFPSTHSFVLKAVAPDSTVLDIGCADGYISRALRREKNCRVHCIDYAENKTVEGCAYYSADLNDDLPDLPWDDLDYVLLMDVIEHLNDPDLFMRRLHEKLANNRKVKLIVSTPNVCFFIIRAMMLLGQFNYGPRGILDITHKRLFTPASLKRFLKYLNYVIEEKKGVPAPYPLAIGKNFISGSLLGINQALAKILPGLFAYQMICVVKPKPSTDYLLKKAMASRE